MHARSFYVYVLMIMMDTLILARAFELWFWLWA